MKILVFGAHGQVGSELKRRIQSHQDGIFLSREDVDLFRPNDAAIAIRLHNPHVVINAAAWTNVDLAETHEDEASIINSIAPEAMAKECAQLRIPFLHLSTDYVFDGASAEPMVPEHPTSPINAYGRTKFSGERKIKQSGAHYLILRTSWVFSSHGKNFLKTMFRLGREKEEISVVADQFGGPTSASSIADALLNAANVMYKGQRGGVYHFSGAPDVSWHEFAENIMAAANLRCRVNKILTVDYPTPARRPLNSCLDCTSFLQDFNIERPDWRIGMREALNELM